MELTRRDFLKMAGVSAAGAALFSACSIPDRELLMQSPVRIPEDTLAEDESWYASVCRQCPAGCGIIVRVIEGRAKKIEGNPDYPVNRGKLCARGQAGVQALYHPDRIQGPMKRVGERGSGQFQPVTWDQALDDVVGRLKQLRSGNAADTVVLAHEPLRGAMAMLVDRFMQSYGGEHLAYEPMDQAALRAGLKKAFGQDVVPEFDIQNAQYLLSFGADFLETWLSPVRYGRHYGEFRQGQPRRRGTFVQVEPRFSMTAANADVWVPIRPGTEGVLALSIAYVLVSEGLADPQAASAMTGGLGPRALEIYSPPRAEPVTGVPAARITELAREFARRQPSLAIGGGSAAAHTCGSFNMLAVFSLNFLVGNVGRPGGVLLNPASPLSGVPATATTTSFGTWKQMADRLRSGQPKPVNLLLVHGANPVYGLPGEVDFRGAMGKAQYVVSFSSFMDETTAQADLILPGHSYLESWGGDIPEPGPGYQTVGLQQPVVNAMYNTRSFGDVLLTIAEELGPDMARALPWRSVRDMLREQVQGLYQLRRGSVSASDFESFWNRALQQGGWWDLATRGREAPPAPALPQQVNLPRYAGSTLDYSYHLIVFPSLSLTDGCGAHLPWLQALPDPISTVVWRTWVEVNAREAQRMGLVEGDIVAVEAPNGRTIEAPVYPHPAMPPGVVGMPAGQGHSAYGRYAENRGGNPLSLVTALTDDETGGLAWAATRVRIRKTGQRIRIPKFEGVVPSIQLPNLPVVQVTRG
ncbi:MAG: molybdopterin-dependent oxidoreductase [Chloroflexi bacterium]|nr:molybdopterin-dependent oxidoreductase [Chloroflexota bacterium]